MGKLGACNAFVIPTPNGSTLFGNRKPESLLLVVVPAVLSSAPVEKPTSAQIVQQPIAQVPTATKPGQIPAGYFVQQGTVMSVSQPPAQMNQQIVPPAPASQMQYQQAQQVQPQQMPPGYSAIQQPIRQDGTKDQRGGFGTRPPYTHNMNNGHHAAYPPGSHFRDRPRSRSRSRSRSPPRRHTHRGY